MLKRSERFNLYALIRLKHPQVTADHSHCPKDRQLTLFYRLLPYLGRIRAQGSPNSGTGGGEAGISCSSRNT
jgi:hypothetical protein